jgi:type VI secretion system protein ImpA
VFFEYRVRAVDLSLQLGQLAEPIAAENPCGENLEETAQFGEIDAYRIFGQLTAPATEPDWRALRAASLSALQKSKDLRLLAHLAAAVIRADTLAGALQLFPLLATWLTNYWEEVFPRVEDDVVMRRNALVAFADRVAIVDPLRRLPLVAQTQLGSFSLRDVDIAMGAQPDPNAKVDPKSNADPKAKAAASMDQINAALSAADSQTLTQLHKLAVTARDSLARVEEIMRSRGGGSDGVPRLDPLSDVLQRIERVLSPRVVQASPDKTVGTESQSTASPGNSNDAVVVGTVNSRADATRALDAVLSYYMSYEPGSPVPLMIERAKRMIPMSFLDALADIVPEALETARTATTGQRAKANSAPAK